MFTLRIRSAADAVAGAVGLLEMIPEDSLCLIFPAVPLAVRLDVPCGAEGVDEFAVRIRALGATYELAAPVAVVFGTQAQARQCLVALRAVREVFTVAAVIRTDTVTCQQYQDGPGEFTPAEGMAVDLGAHPFTAEMALRGVFSLQTEAEIRRHYVPGSGDVAAFTNSPLWEAYRDANAASTPAVADTLAEHLGAVLAPLLVDPAPLTEEQVREIVAGLHIHAVRDRLWLQITAENARAYQDLWRRVAVRCPRALAAEPLALAGFSAWLAGCGVAARVAVKQAAACDAGHTLTQLVDGMLQVGLHPNVWEAQRREAAEEMGVLV